MKILFAISLSILVFFQSVGIGMSDFFMLNDLVEHAQFHSKEYGDDYFTFFEKHYGALKAEHLKSHKDENSQHEKLPFQHNNCNHLITEVVVLGYDFSLKKSVISYTTKPHFYYQDLYFFLERTSIFQPPQTA